MGPRQTSTHDLWLHVLCLHRSQFVYPVRRPVSNHDTQLTSLPAPFTSKTLSPVKLISRPRRLTVARKRVAWAFLMLAAIYFTLVGIGMLVSGETLFYKILIIYILVSSWFVAWMSYRHTLGKLADEVWDDVEQLIVCRGTSKVSIPYSEIVSVERRLGWVCVTLSRDTDLGQQIAFTTTFVDEIRH